MFHCPMCEKHITKDDWHLRLVAHIVTKLSQNMCIIIAHILVYRHARCDFKLWHALWFYCVFWEFSYIINEHLCVNCCIFTKFSQIVRVIKNIFWCVDMLDATTSYERFSGLFINFFWNFNVWYVIFHQTLIFFVAN